MASELRASWSGNNGVPYTVLGHEMVEHLTNGKVIKSVRFRAYRGDTASSVTNRLFDQANAQVHIVYSVVNGEIVQGTPSRLNYFVSLFGSPSSSLRFASADTPSISAVHASAVTDAIGTPVMPASNVDKKVSVFWNNGASWVKVGGSANTATQEVTITTARLGSFQL